MTYSKTAIRTALAKAREAGRDTRGMSPDRRDTQLRLEGWGLLPLPGDTDSDKRVADWYAAQGLAVKVGPEVDKAPEPEAPVIMSATSDGAALHAAEAALAAAQAALAYARRLTA